MLAAAPGPGKRVVGGEADAGAGAVGPAGAARTGRPEAWWWRAHCAAVAEYVPDICRRMRRNEKEAAAADGRGRMPMQGVPANGLLRAELVGWLVELQYKFCLGTETLFLAVDLLDRFLLRAVSVRRGRHWQLVGATALWIVAKFEDERSLRIADVARVTACRREDVRRAEVSILAAVEFRIYRTTAVHFLRWFQVTHGCTVALRDLAQCLLELALVDGRMLGTCSPSHLTASAVMLGSRLLAKARWSAPGQAGRARRRAERLFERCAKGLCGLLEATGRRELWAVRAKFAASPFHGALATGGAARAAASASAAPLPGLAKRRRVGEWPRAASSS